MTATNAVRSNLIRPLAVPRQSWAQLTRETVQSMVALALFVAIAGAGAWLYTGHLAFVWPVLAAYGASALQATRVGRGGEVLLRVSVLWVLTSGAAVLAGWASLTPIFGYVLVVLFAVLALFLPRLGVLWHQIGIGPFSGFVVGFLGFQVPFGPFTSPQRELGWLIVREIVVLGLIGLLVMWLVRSAFAERTPLSAKKVVTTSAVTPQKSAQLREFSREMVQALVAIGLATTIGALIDPVHFVWATIGAMVIFMVPGRMERRVPRLVHRLVGLALGLIIAAVLMPLLVPLGTWGPLLVLVIGAALAHGVARLSYPWFVFWITIGLAPLVLLSDPTAEFGVLVSRFLLNVVGVVLAIAASFLVFPNSDEDTTDHRAGPPAEPVFL